MRLAVITAFRAGEVISFSREVALVKSASLYADSIDVLSFSSLVYTDWGGLPKDEVDLLRTAFSGPGGTDYVPKFTTSSDRLAADSGVNELLPAVREGLITVNDRLPSTGDVWGAFVVEMLRYFNDPSYVVLLDDFLGGIAAQAIRQGRVHKEALRRDDSAEAVIGAGLIARLPAFTEIPMLEVLELRRDLAGPLVRYRSAVASLRTDAIDPYSPSREEVVDLLWRERVAPALLDMTEQLAEHGLIREIARSFGTDVRAVISGLPLRASLTIGAGSALQLGTAVEAVAAGIAALAPPVVAGVGSRQQTRLDIQKGDFYYLYRLNQSGSSQARV